jgi:hypothetical protein
LERVRGISAQARDRTSSERASAAARLRKQGAGDALAAAEREAIELRARVEERAPSFVDSIVVAARIHRRRPPATRWPMSWPISPPRTGAPSA